MNLSRRAFLALGTLAAGLAFPSTSFASEGKDSVLLTEDLALDVARGFANSTNLSEDSVIPRIAMRLYDPQLGAIGYVIDYNKSSGESCGYVILDVTDESLISEFSFIDGSSNPVVSSLPVVNTYSFDDLPDDSYIAVKTEPFTYLGMDTETGELYGPRSYISSISENVSTSVLSSVPDSGSWQDIFFGGDVRSEYDIVEEAYSSGAFYSFSEEYIEGETKRYACAVSAMLNCAPLYLPYGDFFGLGIDHHYDTLWELSDTKPYDNPDGTPGVEYGSTVVDNIGPAFVEYCRGHNSTVYYTQTDSPSFSKFKSTVDSINCAIFSCGINIDGDRHGHSMSVQGYMRMKPKGVPAGSYLDVLCVADGWNEAIRYLNPNYANYTDTNGVFFSRY